MMTILLYQQKDEFFLQNILFETTMQTAKMSWKYDLLGCLKKLEPGLSLKV
jgi:hypothetical protein